MKMLYRNVFRRSKANSMTIKLGTMSVEFVDELTFSVSTGLILQKNIEMGIMDLGCVEKMDEGTEVIRAKEMVGRIRNRQFGINWNEWGEFSFHMIVLSLSDKGRTECSRKLSKMMIRSKDKAIPITSIRDRIGTFMGRLGSTGRSRRKTINTFFIRKTWRSIWEL